ncbi:hypothetical protein DES40_0448 [Litorimonas taeanensis]|uniref:Phosphoribosyltransferase domain-containing protein n=1 Tax=Litorimonas taeanensis TaxID=568099 RepID=A0A420WJF2_9PROT|nr:phosphoribosyltransferase family protein [Litorimonas taeanensis]RKQ71137.1 hypothetical protein DES40_0448 [Litorimonas taeanensis]
MGKLVKNSGIEKLFVSAEDLLKDSFELGLQIFESGYRPSFIVGVWRGGTPVGIAVQEVLELLGCEADHFAIRTSSYEAMDKQSKEVKVYGLQHMVDTINVDDQLLIIDDIFDSGKSVAAIIEKLQEKCRRNTPSDIRVATVYYKPKRNATARIPDFYLHETDEWTVFPHELEGCSLEEIKATKPLPPRIFDLLSKE